MVFKTIELKHDIFKYIFNKSSFQKNKFKHYLNSNVCEYLNSKFVKPKISTHYFDCVINTIKLRA